MKYIGVDFGDARVGIASSDPTGTIANADCVLKVAGIDDAARKTASRASELGGQAFVLGLPVTSEGKEEYRVERTRRFAALLKEQSGLPVCFCDERFTSAEALRYLSEGATFGSKRKKVLDAVAAQIILQSYLDATPGRKAAPNEPPKAPNPQSPAETTKPGEGSKTNENTAPNGNAKPYEPLKPIDNPKAPNPQRPAETTNPGDGSKTNENTTPNNPPEAPNTQRPAETTNPGEGDKTDLPQCGGGHR